MTILIGLIGFIFGITIGSFCNVVIRRGARGKTYGGRSRCESCNTQLSPQELIPIVSFLFQKGRCRTCGTALSWQYPFVEAFTGITYGVTAMYILTAWSPGNLTTLILLYFLFAASIVILVSDISYHIIPNGAVVIFFIVALFTRLPLFTEMLWERIWIDAAAAIGIGGFFAALWFFSKGRWMGFGDAKLATATSFLVGFPASITALLMSFWIGGGVGIILLLTRRKTLADRIPFGPYILLGTAIAYFFPNVIISLFDI